MTNDREYLELAYRAYAPGENYIRMVNVAGVDYWNPLTDSGQALELAVKRKILRCHMDLFHRFYEEEIARGRSEADATRRAIVRAAAEIGRSMK